MVKKANLLKLVNGHVTQILLVAQASLPASQFQAYRTIVLNEFGRNGLEGELDRLEEGVELGEWEGLGRNR